MNGAPSDGSLADATVSVDLPYRAPFAWPRLLGFLAGRAIDGAEAIEEECYRRNLRVSTNGAATSGWLAVHNGEHALRVTLAATLAPALPEVTARLRHVFDLDVDPRAVAAALGPLAADAPGLRLPGAFDPFELAVRAVLGQQITVRAARTLAARFTRAFGAPVATPFDDLNLLFPEAASVAGLTVDEIASLGIIGSRTRTILALAEALASGRLVLAPGVEPAAAIGALKALPGIGEWTAQYIAMRALGAADAFPHTDYGVMKALNEKNPRRVLALAEAWRPFRAYAVMHLWRSLG
jgi:AraC family transcriptional regulator, regulatory protein of adaptative response / DNA-3-methyladenine glycosylase II